MSDKTANRIEELVRKRLSKEFGPLRKDSVLLIDGGTAPEFDIVSKGETVVGQIKSNHPAKKGRYKGHHRPTQFAEFSRDCLLLMAAPARERLFVLTDPVIFKEFSQSEYGRAAKALRIKLLLIEVPA